ncbi:MAG: hypothetical protein RR216_06755, partial [Pseudoflavonifractor sp.]
PATVYASDFLGKANLLSGTLVVEHDRWYIADEGFRIPINHTGGAEGDLVRAAVRGEYFEFCKPEDEGANGFHLDRKIFTGQTWKLIGWLGQQPLNISALGISAERLPDGASAFVRIHPENVVYYTAKDPAVTLKRPMTDQAGEVVT